MITPAVMFLASAIFVGNPSSSVQAIKTPLPVQLSRQVDLRVSSADLSEVLRDISQISGITIQSVGLQRQSVEGWKTSASLDQAINSLASKYGLCAHFDGQKLIVFGEAARSFVLPSRNLVRTEVIFKVHYPWSLATSLIFNKETDVVKVCGDDAVQSAMKEAITMAERISIDVIRGGVMGQ